MTTISMYTMTGTSQALTDQQQRVLDFVARFVGDHGFPPTLREIGGALGLANVSAVQGHLAALEKKGYITKEPDKARSIRAVHPPSAVSEFKRKLHEVFRTDEGVLPHLVYGLGWLTWRRQPILTGATLERVTAAVEHEAGEHGWRLLDRRIEPDSVRLVVETWPNHSPQQTVKRFWASCAYNRLLHPRDWPKGRLWGRGYVVTTDPGRLDEMMDAFKELQNPHEGGQES